MKNKKDDYLDECMRSSGIEASIDQFQRAFCQRCLNTSCKRSKANELLWTSRMERQIQALYEPEFGDLRDPKYMLLAKQEFRTLDPKPIQVSWDLPQPKKQAVVHHADPPEEVSDSTKADEGVSHLKGGKTEKKEAEINVQPEPKPSSKEVSEKPIQNEQVIPQYNTQVPVSGIMLGEQSLLPRTQSPTDSWEVKGTKGKKQKVVVDISSGKVKK